MKLNITCDNDPGISNMLEIHVEHLPAIGDIIEIDGLDFRVTSRRFSPDFSESGTHGIQIILHRED